MTGTLVENNHLHDQRFRPYSLNAQSAAGAVPAGLFKMIINEDAPSWKSRSRLYPMNPRKGLTMKTRRALHFVPQESAGVLLIIGEPRDVATAAERLKNHFLCILLLNPGDSPDPEGTVARNKGGNGPLAIQVTARLRSLRGHLGRFSATVSCSHLSADLMYFTTGKCEYVDLVLDLGKKEVMPAESQPYGYFAPGPDMTERLAVLQTLISLSGLIRDLKHAVP